jgi:dTDP-4-amino-4,6-dideoxygalactose transaminase
VLDAVREVVESGYLFLYGNDKDPKILHKVSNLEKEFANYCGMKYALATSSGTSSLLVSAIALGLKPGDEHD